MIGLNRRIQGSPEGLRTAIVLISPTLGRYRRQLLQLPIVLRGFGHQPIPEYRDLGKLRRRLGADDPVCPRKPRRVRKWSDQTSADEVPCCKRGAAKCNPLTVDGRIKDHAGAIHDRPRRKLAMIDSGGFEPL